ncbi:MAG: DUF924 family protein [Pseudomonadota bacterium]
MGELASNAVNAGHVVSYWLADSEASPHAAIAQKNRWYRGGDEVDSEIRAGFTDAVEMAVSGQLDHWCSTSRGALGLVILLDQFTRTIYRGTSAAFSGDAHAHELVVDLVERGLDRELSVPARIFFYHPFHHAENLTEQNRGVELLRRMLPDYPPAWHGYIQKSIAGFSRHRDIVARFGRFPHRNSAVGRAATPDETAYLAGGPDRFGQ